MEAGKESHGTTSSGPRNRSVKQDPLNLEAGVNSPTNGPNNKKITPTKQLEVMQTPAIFAPTETTEERFRRKE